MTEQLKFYNLDENMFADIAAILVPTLQAGDIILANGDLGAGKTSFFRALIRALYHENLLEAARRDNTPLSMDAIKEKVDEFVVPSPTFAIMQYYEFDSQKIAHSDLYRLEDESELEETGVLTCLDDSISLIEWSKKFPNLWTSREYLEILITIQEDDKRTITLVPNGSYWTQKCQQTQAKLSRLIQT